jgi:NAD(P)-dependent dehydrogenase (short-subunit alcohol dehydrogenase family)
MSISLANKTIVITGASRGIGLGIAKRFAAAEARLHLIADDQHVMKVAKNLTASASVCDIRDDAAIASALSELQSVDVLVNNAGVERLTPIDDDNGDLESVFRWIIDTNIIGTHLMTRRALRLMSRGASIINTASIWGRVAEPLFGAYVASKHAIVGLTKTWAKELGPRKIRVNAVCPGWVRTESSMRSLAHMAKRRQLSEDQLLKEILTAQALPGLMEPTDVADTYLFLASDLAISITGQTIGVDRGEVPW